MYKEFSNIYDNKIEQDFDYKSCYDYIVSILNKYNINKNSMLDSGCGSAKLSSLFKNTFSKITLLDNSEEMLILAREKFDMINQPMVIKGDSSSFTTNNKFDLIVSTLDIPNYFKNFNEVENYISNSYSNLNENGVLIFDISSVSKLESMSSNVFNIDEDDYFHSWENVKRQEGAEEYIDITINIFKEIRKNRYERIIEEQSMLFIENNKIVNFAKNTGFSVEYYDNYSFKEINENTQRITYILRKGKNNG